MPSPTTDSAPIPIQTYQPRHCTFHANEHLVDEKILTHDHNIKPHYDYQCHSKLKVTHRDLGNLSLLSNLTRVQYGYFNNDPAALIGFRFQFQGSSHHSWRFEKADVRISFREKDSGGDVGEGPVLVDFGPKHLASNGTDEKRDWFYTATLSAHAAASTTLPLSLDAGPTAALSAGLSGSYAKHSASTIEGADFSDHEHKEPNIVNFWLREDERQKSRVPLDFDCAVVVKYQAAFEATVDVKVGPVFDLLATPWMAEDPVVFEPGLEYGERIREEQSLVDFATLTVEEWRRMVTPDLKFSEALNNQTQ